MTDVFCAQLPAYQGFGIALKVSNQTIYELKADKQAARWNGPIIFLELPVRHGLEFSHSVIRS